MPISSPTGRGRRQDGVRSGVGIKPPRVPTAVLAGADPAITWGDGNVVRVIVGADASGDAKVSFGRYDGQAILLLTVKNDGAGTLTLPDAATSNVVLSGGAYDFAVNSILMLVWDARQQLWIESPRGIVGPAGADGVDGDTSEDLLELIRWAFRRIAFINAALGIEYGTCEEALPDAWALVEDDAWM